MALNFLKIIQIMIMKSSQMYQKNLIKKLPNFDGCSLRISHLTANILTHCKKLKVISRHGVGYNNVDLDYIKNNIALLITNNANHITVTNNIVLYDVVYFKGCFHMIHL